MEKLTFPFIFWNLSEKVLYLRRNILQNLKTCTNYEQEQSTRPQKE